MRGLLPGADWEEFQLGACGLFTPGGILKAPTPPIDAPFAVFGELLCAGPAEVAEFVEPGRAFVVARPCRPGTAERRLVPDGAPCRESEKAFIFACISFVRPLALEGGGPGRRAAFTGPSGAEELLRPLSKEVFREGGLGDVLGSDSAGDNLVGLGLSEDTLSSSPASGIDEVDSVPLTEEVLILSIWPLCRLIVTGCKGIG